MAAEIIATTHEEQMKRIIDFKGYIRELIQQNVNRFLRFREDILKNSEIKKLRIFEKEFMPLINDSCAEQLRVRLISDKIHLAFCGENSSGKTAFLQLFLGIGKILPSGDGPVTGRITKLTYATSEHACIRIRRTLHDQTLLVDEIKLSEFFIGGKTNWSGIAKILAAHVKRPEGIDDRSSEFTRWAESLVEIHIPSDTLKLGIDVYDTPGFLLDDAPILKTTLHHLVELVHPVIIFMYSNPSTDDGTRGSFLAIKAALHDIDDTSMFFLNSKADLDRMPKYRRDMSEQEFLSLIADERTQRYEHLLCAPFLANESIEGLPKSVDECFCFDLCSKNSQTIKPYGRLINERAIERIIKFVANNDLIIVKRVCQLVLPAIDVFANITHGSDFHEIETLMQLREEVSDWEKICFNFYRTRTERYFNDLFRNIDRLFKEQEENIIKELLNTNISSSCDANNLLEVLVRLQVIQPAIKILIYESLNSLSHDITSQIELVRGSRFNRILVNALGRQEISDFASHLLDNCVFSSSTNNVVLYIANTISVPILQCAQSLRNMNLFEKESGLWASHDLTIFSNETKQDRISKIKNNVIEQLFQAKSKLAQQKIIMKQAIRFRGECARATLMSLFDTFCNEESLKHELEHSIFDNYKFYIPELIRIECDLYSGECMAKFHGIAPEISRLISQSTKFSIFLADWGTKKNLVVKKLSKPIFEKQLLSIYYEAHYHRHVSKLCHPNIINPLYFYKHPIDDELSDLWIIFPPLTTSLDEFLKQEPAALSIQTVLQWMCDITDALATLHSNLLAHRNVTTKNVIINENKRAMLIDLGDWEDENTDLELRRNVSSVNDGVNEDILAIGVISQTLDCRIVYDQKISGVIDEYKEIISMCLLTKNGTFVTTEYINKKLKFILDMTEK